MKKNNTNLIKLISILLSTILAYTSSFRTFLNDNEFGRNFGYLSFIIVLILFYFLFQKLVPSFVNFVIFLIKRFSDKKINERDILYKTLLIPSIIYFIIVIFLFFVTTKFVYITWVYDATTYAEGKELINTNIEFMIIGLIIVSIILFVSLLYILIKNDTKFLKTLVISIIVTFSIVVFFYFTSKVFYIILQILMIIVSILIYGVVL